MPNTFNIELSFFKNSSPTDSLCANAFVTDNFIQSPITEDSSNTSKLTSPITIASDLVTLSNTNKTSDYYTWTLDNKEIGLMTNGTDEVKRLVYNLNITEATKDDLDNIINNYCDNIIVNDIDFDGGRLAITSTTNIDKNFYSELNRDKAYTLGQYSHETKYGKTLPEDIFGFDKIQYIAFIPPHKARNYAFSDRRFKKYNLRGFSVYDESFEFKDAPIYKVKQLPSGFTYLQLTSDLDVMNKDVEYSNTWCELYKYLFTNMIQEYQEAFKKSGIDGLHKTVTSNFFAKFKKDE